jgi:hypothetical protein
MSGYKKTERSHKKSSEMKKQSGLTKKGSEKKNEWWGSTEISLFRLPLP